MYASGLMIIQAILFVAETAVVHHVSTRVSVMHLALLRGIGGVILVICLAWKSGGFTVLRTRQLRLQTLRGFISVLYLWISMYSFEHLPFASATAISYNQAVCIAALSILILGERVAPIRWLAIIISTSGALMIIKPVFIDWNIVYPIALLGPGFNGLAFVLNKYLQRPGGDSELTTMLFVNGIAFICNIPSLAIIPIPNTEAWPWLCCVLVCGPIGMYTGIVAVKYANASTLGPYTFLRLVISMIGGSVLFGEIPDFQSALGACIIIASCLAPSFQGLPIRQYLSRILHQRFP